MFSISAPRNDWDRWDVWARDCLLWLLPCRTIISIKGLTSCRSFFPTTPPPRNERTLPRLVLFLNLSDWKTVDAILNFVQDKVDKNFDRFEVETPCFAAMWHWSSSVSILSSVFLRAFSLTRTDVTWGIVFADALSSFRRRKTMKPKSMNSWGRLKLFAHDPFSFVVWFPQQRALRHLSKLQLEQLQTSNAAVRHDAAFVL